MAFSKFSDEDLTDLIRSWSLTSPDYDIGIDLPIKHSEIEEQVSSASSSFSIELSLMEKKFCKEMLEKVSDNLVAFSLLCRSKVSVDKQVYFDRNLPVACANLVRGIMNEKLTIKPPTTSRYYIPLSATNSTPGFGPSLGVDSLTTLMQEFLTFNCFEKEKSFVSGDQFEEEDEVSLEILSSSPEVSFSPIVRPRTPRAYTSSVPFGDEVGLSATPIVDPGPFPDEQFQHLGARPKTFRSRKWRKKKSVSFE